MPSQQHSPAATVSWPVLSGLLPAVAPHYSLRPETGFGVSSPAEQAPLIRAEASGSYVLAGLGGTGKTQLAAAYARSLWRSRAIELLVWVTATSRAAILAGYAEAFAKTRLAPAGPGAGTGAGSGTGAGQPDSDGPLSLIELARQSVQGGTGTRLPDSDGMGPVALGSYGSGDDLEAPARQFLRWLGESTRSWLVVLDDLADAADLAELWPRGMMGRTVLTTRLPPATLAPPDHPVRVVQVGPFSRREAMSYLTARLLEDTAQRNGALDLAETIGCLPVALSQAADLISDSRIDCREYRRRYADRRTAMGIDPDGGPAATVAVTWSLALDRTDQVLPSALARPMLAMLAMLDRNGIPGAVLTSKAARQYIGSYSADRAPATDDQIREVLAGLAQVGLAIVDPGSAERTVSMHELVQSAVRQVLPDGVRGQAAVAAASATLQAWPDHGAEPQLDQALRDCAAALAAAAPEVMWSFEAYPLLLRAGHSLNAARLSWPAVSYWRSLVEAGDKAQGSGHMQTLELMQLLAAAYQDAGRIDLALDVLTDALAQLEEEPGPGHPDTLTARIQLARAFRAADRLSDAIPHFESALAGREWVLGPDHPDTLAARSDLADSYRSAGRLDDAIIVFRRTLADQELILGVDHPTTVATRGSLATALHAAGQVKDAIPLYERTLADRERLLGPSHPLTLAVRESLAAIRS